MSYIYYKHVNNTRFAIDGDFRVAVVNPWTKSRHSFLWKIMSIIFAENMRAGAKFCEYQLINKNNKVVSKAELVSWIPIFKFMPRKAYHIGPCFTVPKERGKGFYPYLLNCIIADNPTAEFYMIVDESNLSSIKGIQKAGFVEIGRGYKDKYGFYRLFEK